jgi:putative solute:sodium symporter small subunit
MSTPDRADAAPSADPAALWRRTLRITALLLALWFAVTFGLTWFARDLSFAFAGWPFSYWLAAQGALLVYLLLIWVCARVMNSLDDEGELRSTESDGV